MRETPIDSSSLRDLGWGEPFQSEFEATAEKGSVPGRVVEEQRGGYVVRTETGEWLARISGRLRHQSLRRIDFPAVGDWVTLKIRPLEKKATLLSILTRQSTLSRKASGHETDDQLIATNLDTVFVVTSLNSDFSLRRLERYLSLVSNCGAVPVVLLSKADLTPDSQVFLRDVQALAPGVAVFAVSAVTGLGLSALTPYLKTGETVALIGSSGVGKSTLINRLSDSHRQTVQAVRAGDDRGRHTTTFRRLIPLPQGGLLIDTPGMRELRLTDTQGVADTFADVLALIGACRFGNCRHQSDAGCAVQSAIQEGRLTTDRYANYLQLGKESDTVSQQRDSEAHAKANEKFKRTKEEYKRDRRKE